MYLKRYYLRSASQVWLQPSYCFLCVGGGQAVGDVEDEGVALLAHVGLAAHGVGRGRRGAA